MTTYSGAWNGRLRLQIEVDFATPDRTTNVRVTVKYYVQTDGYDFNDAQTLKIAGRRTNSFDFFNDLTGVDQRKLIHSWTDDVGTNYAGSNNLEVSASLSGAFNGASPKISIAPKIPARKPDVPNATNVTLNVLSPVGIRLGASSKPDGNGATPTRIRYRYGADSTPSTVQEIPAWEGYTMTGLTRGKRYYAQAAAWNSEGWGPYGSVESAVTEHTVPDRPSMVLDSRTATSLIFDGTDAAYDGAGITARENDLSTTSSFSNVIKNGVSLNPGYYGLTRYTTYYARLRTRNAVGWSDWSPTATARTLATAPSVPRSFAAPSKGITSVSLSWVAPSDSGGPAVAKYWVEYKLATSSTWLSGGETTGLSRTVSGLSGGRAYNFRVRAYHGVDGTGWSVAAPLNVTTNPASADQPVQTDQTPSSVTFDWEGTVGATGYGWEVRTADAGGGTIIGSGSGATTGPVTVSGLDAFTTCYARTRVTAPSVGAWTDSTVLATSPPIRVWRDGAWDWAQSAKVWVDDDWVDLTSIDRWNGTAFVPAATT
jgi:hypothetical protein